MTTSTHFIPATDECRTCGSALPVGTSHAFEDATGRYCSSGCWQVGVMDATPDYDGDPQELSF